MLGNSGLELRFSLGEPPPHRDTGLIEPVITGVCAERKTTEAASPHPPHCLPETEEKRGWAREAELGLCALPFLFCPFSSQQDVHVGPRILLVL